MTDQDYDIDQLIFDRVADAGAAARWHFVWAHGWGQNRAALKPLAQSLFTVGTHDFIDFPGFGDSPKPATAWSTAEYADFMARWLGEKGTGKPVVWTGHSFGCRVGIQLAARHPGVDRSHDDHRRCRPAAPALGARAGQAQGPDLWLQGAETPRTARRHQPGRLARPKFGSADYKAAGRDARHPDQGRQRRPQRCRESIGDLPGASRLRAARTRRRRRISASGWRS